MILHNNWEGELFTQLPDLLNGNFGRAYICSPLGAATTDGIAHNMRLARAYMYYVHSVTGEVAVAPHGILPYILNDNSKEERELALDFGLRYLSLCDSVMVCGNKLTNGMTAEVMYAADHGIPITVYSEAVYKEVVNVLQAHQLLTDSVYYNTQHPLLSGTDIEALVV